MPEIDVRLYTKPQRLKSVVLFLLDRERFAEHASKHDLAWSYYIDSDGFQKFHSGDRLPAYKQKFRDATARRLVVLRQTLVSSTLLVTISAVSGIACGILFAHIFGSISPLGNSILQIFGAAILLLATIWQLSTEIQTLGGETLIERVHSWLFRGLCVFGTLLLFIAYGWTL